MDEYRGLDTVARNSESSLQVRPMTNDRQIKQIHNVGTICDIVQKILNNNDLFVYGGRETGIRTLGTLAGTTDFESVPFDHSGTSPHLSFIWYHFETGFNNFRNLLCVVLFDDTKIFPAFIASLLSHVEIYPPAALIIGINGCISQILFEH